MTRQMKAWTTLVIVVVFATAAIQATAIDGIEPTDARVTTAANQMWTVRMGTTTIEFDLQTMAERGLKIADSVGTIVQPDQPSRSFRIDPISTLSFSFANGHLDNVAGRIFHLGGMSIIAHGQEYSLGDLIVGPGSDPGSREAWIMESSMIRPGGLAIPRMKAGFDLESQTLTIRGPELRISPALAQATGDPKFADVVIGRLTISAVAESAGGGQFESSVVAPMGAGGEAAVTGPDMTFCQLNTLKQYGRMGSEVGLAVGTTSWNIGDEDLKWFAIPGTEHPFIVMNLFRLKDGRFEQIGQSEIKHGFYALGSHQCGGVPCHYEPGHYAGAWLGTGCTDTYTSGLNAQQSGMGPRYEVNPWTGVWSYSGSHMALSGHGHNPLQHRLQVHDDDLNPALNQGATYYSEGYYVVTDDVNVMNSAAWKPVTVNGAPGSNWFFGMSSAGVYPNIGFAMDAWADAQKSTIAQELPIVEFVSPDGRCLMAGNATDLGGGVHHYEYAVYNIDMDRQVGSFTIPIPSSATITNIGFHAVSHDEPRNAVGGVPIDNAAWDVQTTGGSITWSTDSNPIRWGSMYNFRFDADVAPAADPGEVVLGLFKPGNPAVCIGETVIPALFEVYGDSDQDGDVDLVDCVEFMLCFSGPGVPSATHCAYNDFDGDRDVDFADYGDLLLAFTGSL